MSAYAGNLRGIVAITAGMASLIVNDIIAKVASEAMPLGQLIFTRGLAATLFTLVLCFAMGQQARLREAGSPKILARAFVNVLATFAYLTALFNMPIANASAITQAVPLVLTALAALLLGEHVGPRRWAAIVVGLLGVLVVMRPTPGAFNVYALSALAAVAFVAIRDLITRVAASNLPSIIITFTTTVFVTGAGALVGIFEDWVMLDASTIALIVTAAAFLVGGVHLTIVALRVGEVAVVSLFRFSVVVWSILGGYVVWREVPDGWTFVGIAMIVGAAVYTLWRERRVSADIAGPHPPTIAR